MKVKKNQNKKVIDFYFKVLNAEFQNYMYM